MCPKICKRDLVWQHEYYAAGINKYLDVHFSFNETFWPELASPWGGHQSNIGQQQSWLGSPWIQSQQNTCPICSRTQQTLSWLAKLTQRWRSMRIPLLHIISLPVRLFWFTRWSQNIHRMAVRRAYLLWSCSIYQLFLFLFITGKLFTIGLQSQTGNCWNCWLEAMYRQYYYDICKPTTVEKMDRCSCFGVGKDPGWNSVTWNIHTWHSRQNWSQGYQQISATARPLLNGWWNIEFILRATEDTDF